MAHSDIPDQLQVGSRIQVQQARATVRFIGSVENTKGIWLGVEWDDPARGKHDGTHQGVPYFNLPGSGSFIRYHPEKVQLGRPFLEALKEKYLDDTTGTGEYDASKDVGHVYFGGNRNIKFETVGFEKVQRQQRHLNTLVVVGLAEQSIASKGPENAITEEGLVVEDLDLSRNLLANWDDVADIVVQLPKLRILRLKQVYIIYCYHDPFSPPTESFCQRTDVFEHLTTLALNNTRTTWHDIELIAPLLTSLEDLQLGGNRIDRLSTLTTLRSLKCINLEENDLDRWEEVEKLGSLPSLQTIYLLRNKIPAISRPAQHTFRTLSSLWLDHNCVQDWESLDNLSYFPQLRRLRCKGNPVFQDMDTELMTTHIVGRIKSVDVVNGITITSQERTDFERYYLKLCAKAGKTHQEIAEKHPRYEELCQLHGEPNLDEKIKNATLKDRLMGVTLSLREGNADTLMAIKQADDLPAVIKTAEKKFLATMLIRNLRHIIQKLFRVPAHQQQLFLIQPHGSGILVMDLSDDLRDLKFYCVSPGDEIVVLDSQQ
ncbi:hypothetical protein EC973_001053 [Apophysomyces ossiformis]|uniref:CAP-Gly domain-containing protein n=1 Tax=Apophysomyces ossiformis TaxID=679940 RepID=A0A8H7BRV6_9FUNG|nr:hypothetical protein EC973_001053 [Apophysomyces ossiformis]